MLVAGRIDVFNEDRAAMNASIQKAGLKGEIIEAGSFPKKLDLYLGFARNEQSDEYRKRFDSSFATLLKSGKIDDILQRHDVIRSGQ